MGGKVLINNGGIMTCCAAAAVKTQPEGSQRRRQTSACHSRHRPLRAKKAAPVGRRMSSYLWRFIE